MTAHPHRTILLLIAALVFANVAVYCAKILLASWGT